METLCRSCEAKSCKSYLNEDEECFEHRTPEEVQAQWLLLAAQWKIEKFQQAEKKEEE